MHTATLIKKNKRSPRPVKAIIFYFVFLIASYANLSFAAVFPPDNAHLNYRIIGFTFPAMANATDYAVEIAGGMLMDAQNFTGAITHSSAHTNKVVAEVPNFGSEYTWRAVYSKNGVVIGKSALYHFSIERTSFTDTTQTRLKILTNNYSEPYYVLVDGARTIYDLNGAPVWYLPPSQDEQGTSEMKVSPSGTITMLVGAGACEIDYNGRLLWTAPKKANETSDTVSYHHEFTKLRNGHYMALGSSVSKDVGRLQENVSYQQQLQKNGQRLRFFKNPLHSQLYEFDSTGKLVWSWESTKYYEKSDIAALYRENFSKMAVHGHENAFYFDEKNSVVYLSFATFNRVIKISYPSGEVLKTYGPTYTSKGHADSKLTKVAPEHALANPMFNGQHSCRLNKNGDLYLLNNNMSDTTSFPKIVVFKETEDGANGGIKKIWEYECRIAGKKGKIENSGGGCVNEMENGDMFVMMNNPYSQTLIVNKDKKLMWSAIPERKNENNEWSILPSYRASVISRAELELLIYNTHSDPNGLPQLPDVQPVNTNTKP